ncbi:hypothetical protein CIW48_19805 [Methylobacterium sp. P1-11]|uniref:hypothetical protein n=1 Tax=Methylobacterium sp. P1-11 TaxID=2024616 RepID=UPI0011ED3521|nr:hypothetical protein [Methylobacterium sp. P1-11]KAA0122238.1 hypothetical protein CIW48_19805 [Methylobacterium sp. P1-11]
MALMKRKSKEAAGSAADAADLERLRRDLDAAEAERVDAVRARQDLEERRDDVLASEDVAQLEAHEIAVAAVERRVAVAEIRCTRLAGEIETAEAEAEQARRRAAYAQAQEALAEGRRVLEQEYLPAAMALVEILNRARTLRAAIAAANEVLPDGSDPLPTMLEPVFNGQHYPEVRGLTKEEVYFVNRKTGLRAGPFDCPELHSESHKWERRTRTIDLPLPLHPAVEHRSVLEYVNLPGITGPDSYLWSAPFWGRPRFSNSDRTEEQRRVL